MLRRTVATFAAALALLASAAPALAQRADEVAELTESDRWIAVVAALVLIAAVGVASFLSSRRGHQD